MRLFTVICLSVLMLIVGCQQQPNQRITLNNVVTSFEAQQLELKANKDRKNSILGAKLNGVKPAAYLLDDLPLYIYIYGSSDKRKKGLKDFQEKTATMNMVSFTVYEKGNVLIFYVHGQNLNTKLEMDRLIKQAIDQL